LDLKSDQAEVRVMYKCKYFSIQELVSPTVYQQKGEGAWRFFNPVALKGLDKLRERYGAMIRSSDVGSF
jgi:hypothetical protein